MTARTVWVFFGLAFAIGWGLGILMVVFADQIESVFGEIGYTNPVFILVVYSPAMAGLGLVWRHYGTPGVKLMLRRVTLWRLPSAWWVFLILGIPAVKLVGAGLNGSLTDTEFSSWAGLAGLLVAGALIGPMEEFGWRGVALPLLQRRLTPLTASLVLGAFWGLWHLPAFLMSGTPQSGRSFGPFIIGVLALSVLVTPLFNASRGSILIPALFHFQMNNPLWPDAQPWENYLFALVAVVVVVICRRDMLSRHGAVTTLLGETEPQIHHR